jgi:hypothetical protein
MLIEKGGAVGGETGQKHFARKHTSASLNSFTRGS